LPTWNIRSLYTPGGLRIPINELRKYKIAIAAIQETRWDKLTPQAFTSNGYNIYTSSLANNHGFGTAFLVVSKFNHLVINFTPINDRLCVIRIKGRFFNIHAPTNYSAEEAKDKFDEQLEQAYAACPSHDVKLVMGNANAKVGRETVISQRYASTACIRVQMKMASDWLTLPQAGKWRSKVRTSCTNEATYKPVTPQMNTPSTRSINA
jgi:NACalpha-BTF3-like transcription factor